MRKATSDPYFFGVMSCIRGIYLRNNRLEKEDRLAAVIEEAIALDARWNPPTAQGSASSAPRGQSTARPAAPT
jgi:hypothetical protein